MIWTGPKIHLRKKYITLYNDIWDIGKKKKKKNDITKNTLEVQYGKLRNQNSTQIVTIIAKSIREGLCPIKKN